MSFANPWMFLLLLPLAFAAWRLVRYSRRTGIRFSAVGRLPVRTSGWRAYVAAAAPFILLAGLTLLVVAAARPRTPREAGDDASRQVDKRSVESIAIVMTVDVSGSMAILDLAPAEVRARLRRWWRERPVHFVTESEERSLAQMNRLAVVKRLFAEFVNRRPDDFIGLVTFGTYAQSVTPLTRDHRTLLQALSQVEIPEEAMTAIGDGLGLALARLEEATPKSKVIVLLSDGMQTVKSSVKPEDMAAVAARRGVKIHAIGIGTQSHEMPVVGQSSNPWHQGRKIIGMEDSAFDEAQLKGVAEVTGGRYFSVNDRQALQEALAEIDRLEKTTIEESEVERASWQLWRDHFQGFLWTGSILVMLALVLSMTASRRLA